jgi:hypothetical protein
VENGFFACFADSAARPVIFIAKPDGTVLRRAAGGAVMPQNKI